MANNASNYTQLTKARLGESNRILQDIADTCDRCAKGDITWSQACQKKGLDPRRTRKLVLGLGKCVADCMALEDIELENMYDPYENFYRDVFGDRTIRSAALPYDYKESVLHILKDTGLRKNYAEVLIRRYGLGDGPKETLEEIADSLHVIRSRVHQIELDGLRACRCVPRIEILKLGLSKYSLQQYQARMKYEQELEQEREEHEALMTKQRAAHKERLDAILADVSQEEPLKKIKEKLYRIPIEALNLNIRSHNALIRNGVYSLFDLLSLDTVKDNMTVQDKAITGLKLELMALRGMGTKTMDETIKRLDDYSMERFAMTAEELRGLLMPLY